ncbi:DUF885 domain-containing protein [Tsuneonella sp. HG222]
MRLLFTASLLAFALPACATLPPATETQPSTVTGWAAQREAFIEGYFRHFPEFAVYQGRHEFDGRLPDITPAGLAAKEAFLRESMAAAQALSGLSPAEGIERDHLVLLASDELFKLNEERRPYRNPAYYTDLISPAVYMTRDYAPAPQRLDALIAHVRALPAFAKQIEANLQLPLPETFVRLAASGYGGMADYLTGDTRVAFKGVGTADQQRQLVEATDAAAIALKALADRITQAGSTPDGYAMGAENFARMNAVGEGVDVSLAELERIGRADLARNQAALREACGRFAPGASIGDCMARMEANKSAGGPVAGARRQLPGLREFLVAKDLVTIPGTEEALVEESPPYRRNNSAYISIPGPYETGLPATYYISPPDPSWDAATQANFVPGEYELMFTSVHEVWPGHFLQFLHSNRSQQIFPRVFVTYGLAEGWGHYTEEMMWDAGLGDGNPEVHIGQLAKALLRNCRYLSAIGLHAQGWTVDRSRDLFRDECYQDEGTARQQAARGTYDPRYLNYTLGKLQIMRLRDDWTANRGGRKAWKTFHDTFLSYGGAPIPLIRQAMMGEAEPQARF